MPYKIQWYIPGYVVYARYWDQISEEEFKAFLQSVNGDYLSHGQGALVHMVIDVTQATSIPTLQQMTSAVGKKTHPSTGWTLVVGTVNPARSWMGNFIAQLLKFRFRRFSSVPQALAFLREMDDHLDWAKADESVLSVTP